MIKEWSVSPKEGEITQCVRRFGVPKEDPSEVQTREGKGFVRFLSFSNSIPRSRLRLIARVGIVQIKNHIVAVKMSPTNSRDLLVSYSEKGIYRFDIHGEEFRFEPTPSPATATKKNRDDEDEGGGKYKRRRSEEEIGGGKEVPPTPIEGVPMNTSKERVRPVKREEGERVEVREESESIEKSSEEINNETQVEFEGGEQSGDGDSDRDRGSAIIVEPDEVIYTPITPRAMSPEEEDSEREFDENEEEEEEPSQTDLDSPSSSDNSSSPFSPIPRSTVPPHASIPLIPAIAHYTGHANSQTVKDVNFAFEGKVVVSGSDDGNWFAWDLDSEKCLGIWKGDSSGTHLSLPLFSCSTSAEIGETRSGERIDASSSITVVGNLGNRQSSINLRSKFR